MFWKYSKKSSSAVPLAKIQPVRLEPIILYFSKPFKSNFWKLLVYEREILAWIWCHNIDSAYPTRVTPLIIFLKFRHKALEISPCDNEKSAFEVLHKTHTTLVQRRNFDIEKTLWIWRCNFNIVSMLPLQNPW